MLVTGPTGSGKSTLLGVVTGLVPRFSGGVLSGDVLLDGVAIRAAAAARAGARDRVRRPGPAGRLRHRHRRGGAGLRHGAARAAAGDDAPPGRGDPRPARHRATCASRDLRTLSGGEQQRVAIGSVLTMHPRLLVLDEPTSALDPTAAEEVLATLTRLVHDLGVTVLLAEHRLERVVPFADRICLVRRRLAGGRRPGRRARDLARRTPLVELGRAAGWSPAAAERARRATPGERPGAGRPGPGRRRRGGGGGGGRVASGLDGDARPDGRGARGVPHPAPGPGHRADGPQRLGQVLAALGAAGQRRPACGLGRDRRRGPGRG